MDKGKIFHDFLNEKKIGVQSSAIPDEAGRFKNGVPLLDDMTAIPKEETYPLEEAEKVGHLSEEELKTLFVMSQVEAINLDPTGSTTEDSEVVGPILEIPGEFNSIEDFVLFKRELAAVYKRRSEIYGWPEYIGVCHDPLCLNSAGPGFTYCIYHLPKDPKNINLGLISSCQTKVDDHECPIPCGIGCTKCAFHRLMPRDNIK